MKQGETEAKDDYLERFKWKILTIELTGGKHLFCSKGITTKDNDDPTDDEIKIEEDKMQAILLLKIRTINVMVDYQRVWRKEVF